MSNMHTIIKQGSMQTAVALINGQWYTVAESDPHFANVVAQLDAGVYKPELFDVFKALEHNPKQLTERIKVNGRTILFDNDPQSGIVADQVLHFLDHDEDVTALVNFWELSATNPVPHSREQGARFLAATASQGPITITTEGMLVAYKGMNRSSDADGDYYRPTSNGLIIVNGETGRSGDLQQRKGDIVEMPRSEVVHDPGASCSVGLHVGTFNYATHYGNRVLAVLVNPRDMVSVPNGEDEKMRVCRYQIIGEVTEPHKGVVIEAPSKEYEVTITNEMVPAEQIVGEPIKSDGALEDEDDGFKEPDAFQTPANETPKESVTSKIKRKVTFWDDKKIKRLMKCKTNAQLQKAFPSKSIEGLKRRQREFRAKGW